VIHKNTTPTMSMYPSLEDMKVDQMLQAQNSAVTAPSAPSSLPYPVQPPSSLPPPGYSGVVTHGPPQVAQHTTYPGLSEYMGMELSEGVIRENMPEYLPGNQQSALSLPSTTSTSLYSGGGLVAPISGSSPGLIRAQVSHGVRQVVLCKDGDGKIGLRVKDINKGIFVCLVTKNSPAALGGLRFGDQILQINSENVAGCSSDKVHSILKKAGVNNIVLAVRDRPFERTLTLHKDSSGHIGFQFKEGKITSIAVESSAARNGLLVDHNLLEVNGQNVVGVKDKEVGAIIDEGGSIITVTIIPTYMYNHIMKNMSSSLVKKMMDHSIPDV